MDIELAYLPAVEIAAKVRNKEISPVDIVENSLARIDQVNSALNCFCFVYHEDARKHARIAEQDIMAGKPIGPLHGVPIAFKDMTPIRGLRTTRGSRAFEHWIPDRSAVIVERLLEAGAILVGKATTSELAATGITETNLWGVTRNPWDTTRTPGGSSGGSAVAVAAGCVPLAEGCDMGGSIRIPAAFCGIAGLKPSFGRIPFDILPSQFDTHCHFGPLARCVDDAALFLNCAQGHDDRDILSLPDRLQIPAEISHDVRGLRLALSVDFGYYAVDPEVETNLRAVADTLRSRGAVIDEVEIGWTRQVNDIGYHHWNAYMAAYAGPLLAKWRDVMDPVIIKAVEDGLKMDAVELKKLEIARTDLWEKLRIVFQKYDALICPTTSMAAPPTGVSDLDYGGNDPDGRYHQFEMTFPFNLFSPCPALSMLSGFTGTGLPTAVQLVGRPYDDLMVLRLGAAVEMASPWRDARPPI